MLRRKFIKNALLLSCAAVSAPVCKSISYNKLKNDRFYIESDEDLPRRVRIDACSLCQLDCPECPVRKYDKSISKDWLGYLKFKDFKKFIDDNKYIELVELSYRGEIFLNPELDNILEYAYKKNVFLTALNGVNLNTVSDTTLENLVKYKFKTIKVSIDGATPEVYKIYRKGGDFNKVIENIEKINYFKKKYDSKFPTLIWQFILFGHNEHEITLAKKKAQELGMKMVFRKNFHPDYSPIRNKKFVEQQLGFTMPKTPQEDVFNKDSKEELYVCDRLFNCPQIDFDGTLMGCTFAPKSYGVNVFKVGLKKALNSKDYLYAKNAHVDFSLPMKENIPCSNCIFYSYVKKKNIIYKA